MCHYMTHQMFFSITYQKSKYQCSGSFLAGYRGNHILLKIIFKYLINVSAKRKVGGKEKGEKNNNKGREKQKEPSILNVSCELIKSNYILHCVSGREENYWCSNSCYFIKSHSVFFPKLLKQSQTDIKIQPVVKSYFPFVTELLKGHSGKQMH